MKFLFSVKDRNIAFKLLQALIVISIFKNVLCNPINNHMQIFNIALLVLLWLNDYFRNNFSRPIKYFSYILSNLIICYVSYSFHYMEIVFYYTLMIINIITLREKIAVGILIINFICYVISTGILNSNNLLTTLTNSLFSYSVTLLICILIRHTTIEKRRKEQLYKELRETNLTLKEYSNKIEELTIEKERTRIAEELHDSIGHSLVALSMNLEYAENIIDLRPQTAKTTIQNCHTLSKDCLKTLRKVVSVLKEDTHVINLREELEKIFINFRNTNKYQFNLNFDEQVENTSTEIKTCIFKTLREAITNGIKHGNATSFNINIYKLSSYIVFKFDNNGKSCNEIVRSNGIIGMEERIHTLNGEIFFYSHEIRGFSIEGKIPENTLMEVN